MFGNLNYLRNKHYIVFLQNAKLRALLCEAVRMQRFFFCGIQNMTNETAAVVG